MTRHAAKVEACDARVKALKSRGLPQLHPAALNFGSQRLNFCMVDLF